MSPNDNTNILKKPFMNKDKAEWDTFSSDLVSVMALKKNKLDMKDRLLMRRLIILAL